MTTAAQRTRYSRDKALLIDELHAQASRLQDEIDKILERVRALDAETFEDAYGERQIDEGRDSV